MEKVKFAKDVDALKLTHPQTLVETFYSKQFEVARNQFEIEVDVPITQQ
jgi:hypothetical protein